jgi:cytochrome P450
MLQTIEAIIEPSGAIHLLEEFHVRTPMRAIVTVLDFSVPKKPTLERGSSAALLQFSKDYPLTNQDRRSAAEMEAGIDAERTSWE